MAIELTTATTQQLSGIRQSLSIGGNTVNLLPNATYLFFGLTSAISNAGNTIDFKNCQNITSFTGPNGNWSSVSATFTSILNAQDLINLENIGTNAALNMTSCGLTDTLIDQLFTDLPATNKTATINVVGNPGAATCNTSIATNKGYTVVTS